MGGQIVCFVPASELTVSPDQSIYKYSEDEEV